MSQLAHLHEQHVHLRAVVSRLLQTIDFVAEARLHFAEIGHDVPEFDDRLRACQIYIGLDGQAYQARFGLLADLERTARRTLEIATR